METAKRWWDPGSARNSVQAVVLGAALGVAKMAGVVGAPQSMEKIPSWPTPARWCDAIGARLAALALPPSPPLLQSAMLRTAHRKHSARHSATRACSATPRSKSPLAFSKVIAAGMATCGPGAGCALRPYGSLHGNAIHAAAAHAPSMTRNRQRCSGRCARCRRWASAGCVARGANKSLMAYGVWRQCDDTSPVKAPTRAHIVMTIALSLCQSRSVVSAEGKSKPGSQVGARESRAQEQNIG